MDPRSMDDGKGQTNAAIDKQSDERVKVIQDEMIMNFKQWIQAMDPSNGIGRGPGKDWNTRERPKRVLAQRGPEEGQKASYRLLRWHAAECCRENHSPI
jgi:hypothetical protein